MKKKLNLVKNYQSKPLKIPDLIISSEEKKPFTMWFLINNARVEFRFNWNFFGGKKHG